MKFHYATLETCRDATGTVIVVDVIRAFTSAAFAFSRGAARIFPVSTVEEALELKARKKGSLACGEVGGLPPAGFDFGNSPSRIADLDLRGRDLIQRTGAGTQGIVRSERAEQLFAASFVVASPTVSHIQKLAPQAVTFVITGEFDAGRGDYPRAVGGDEDRACAEYLEALFRGQSPDVAPFIRRVYGSRDALMHLDPEQPEFPQSDLDYCSSVNAFDFAMPVMKEDGLFVVRAIRP
jgi:2-phosphosulfolactate phosphatase